MESVEIACIWSDSNFHFCTTIASMAIHIVPLGSNMGGLACLEALHVNLILRILSWKSGGHCYWDWQHPKYSKNISNRNLGAPLSTYLSLPYLEAEVPGRKSEDELEMSPKSSRGDVSLPWVVGERIYWLWVVVSKMLYFQPDPWGNKPIWLILIKWVGSTTN